MRVECAAILLAVVANLGLAQETTGDIRGRLRASGGPPVAGASVVATSADMLGPRRAKSMADGVFLLSALPPGQYTLRITAIGYNPTVIDSVRVQLGQTNGLPDTELRATAAQLSEVRIVSPRVALDPARTTIGATLEAAELAALPAGRDYHSLMTILPHVNTSYHGDPANSGGSSGLENMYFVDGVNSTTPFRATAGTSLPYNFVRSVQVRSGGYEAQYGRALGAIVNAVTYTGTNEFESSAFAFFTQDGLSATPRAQPSLREIDNHSYDIGIRISGPFIRDRLWFSAAYNPRLTGATREITALGLFPERSHSDVFASKVTWHASPILTVESSFFGDPTVQHLVSPSPFVASYTPLEADPYLIRAETGGTIGSIRATAMFANSLLLEASLGRSSSRENMVGDSERARSIEPFIDNVAGTVSGGMPYSTTVEQGITSATIRASVAVGRHRVSAGGEYEAARVRRTLLAGAGIGLIQRIDGGYSVLVESANGSFRNIVPVAFLQDSWRVNDHLTVNAGLRWSRQSIEGSSGSIAQHLSHEWQPRLGFSLLLNSNGAQRVFGSYGRFYQQEPLNLATLYYVPYVAKGYVFENDPREPGAVATDSSDFSSTEADFAGMADGATAERFDEYQVGYEQLLGTATRLTVRAMHRRLGTAFQHGVDFTRGLGFFLGTPGEKELFFLPPVRRDYTALEISADGTWRRMSWRSSYVFSRTYGNHTGLYGSDQYFPNPGVNFGLSVEAQGVNSTGLLPNDRPHVLKVAGAIELTNSLTGGMTFAWMSGTPLTAFGVDPMAGFPLFLYQRGSAGRLPPVRDLNVRLAQELTVGSKRAKAMLDVFHVGNPQTVVRVDQHRYRVAKTSVVPPAPNPSFMRPLAFVPPTQVRLGMEFCF